MTTLKTAWREAKDQLESISSSASLDAQVLLADVLGADDRAYLFAHPEQTLTPEQLSQYATCIDRRQQGEPIAYIRGFKDWYDRRIIVTPDVLIPRPETELLLEAALDFAKSRTDITAADVCTGSGALAVTFAALNAHATVYATDISVAALTVAKQNATLSNATVTFYAGDLLAPLLDNHIQVHLLMTNPPYIDPDVLAHLAVSKYEPVLALDGGQQGMAFIERLLRDIPRVCASGAMVLMEIGADQGELTLELANHYLNPINAIIVKDYAGHDRFLKAILP